MIKFPRVHIATSVTNRILKLADGIAASRQKASPDTSRAPVADVADTSVQSIELDAALAAPTPELPGVDDAPDAGASLSGSPLLDTVLKPGG